MSTWSWRYRRRCQNLKQYPLITAKYFHRKTELFVQQIATDTLGADAHWMRYEWQSRGSTHVHYFLWLRGAPCTDFLNRWTRAAIDEKMRTKEDGVLHEDDIDEIVEDLNARATAAMRHHAIKSPSNRHQTARTGPRGRQLRALRRARCGGGVRGAGVTARPGPLRSSSWWPCLP